MDGVIVGKRVKVGAAITSMALVFGKFWPEYLDVFVAAGIPTTFVVQLIIVKYWGVTK